METAIVEARDEDQYLTFFVAGDEYGVGILQSKEILQYDTITKVPRTPSYISGVLNLRGRVVPVVDLGVKFGLGETKLTKRCCIVITEVMLDGEKTVFGMLVDRVSQVMDLGEGDMEPPPVFGTGVRADYLAGMGKVDNRFVLILNVDKLLSETEIFDVAAVRKRIEGGEAAAGNGESSEAAADPSSGEPPDQEDAGA